MRGVSCREPRQPAGDAATREGAITASGNEGLDAGGGVGQDPDPPRCRWPHRPPCGSCQGPPGSPDGRCRPGFSLPLCLGLSRRSGRSRRPGLPRAHDLNLGLGQPGLGVLGQSRRKRSLRGELLCGQLTRMCWGQLGRAWPGGTGQGEEMGPRDSFRSFWPPLVRGEPWAPSLVLRFFLSGARAPGFCPLHQLGPPDGCARDGRPPQARR